MNLNIIKPGWISIYQWIVIVAYGVKILLKIIAEKFSYIVCNFSQVKYGRKLMNKVL